MADSDEQDRAETLAKLKEYAKTGECPACGEGEMLYQNDDSFDSDGATVAVACSECDYRVQEIFPGRCAIQDENGEVEYAEHSPDGIIRAMQPGEELSFRMYDREVIVVLYRAVGKSGIVKKPFSGRGKTLSEAMDNLGWCLDAEDVAP